MIINHKLLIYSCSFQDGRVIQYLLKNLAQIDVADGATPKDLIDNCIVSADQQLGIPNMFSADDLARGQVAEE